jgi:hypothetical protein
LLTAGAHIIRIVIKNVVTWFHFKLSISMLSSYGYGQT